MKPTADDRGKRLEQLDSLRGLAAVSVVIWHQLAVLPQAWEAYLHKNLAGPGGSPFWPPFFSICDGPAAVILFFILSGYVLALPTLKGRQDSYPRYLIKRICRIYLPYCVAVFPCLLAVKFHDWPAIPELSSWFNSSWEAKPTAQDFWDHALLVGSFNTEPFNNVIWSLVHEMRISLVFPLLALFVAKRKNWESWALALGLFYLGPILAKVAVARHLPIDGSFCDSIHYGGLFVLGALLAKLRGNIQLRVDALSPLPTAGVLIVALTLYSSNGLLSTFYPTGKVILWDLPVAVGAAVLIVFSLSAGWLLRPFFLWLGHISYSLYLCHIPVTLLTVRLGYPHASLPVLLLLSFSLSLAVASVLHRLAEVPSMALGKRLSGILPRRPIEENVALAV